MGPLGRYEQKSALRPRPYSDKDRFRGFRLLALPSAAQDTDQGRESRSSASPHEPFLARLRTTRVPSAFQIRQAQPLTDGQSASRPAESLRFGLETSGRSRLPSPGASGTHLSRTRSELIDDCAELTLRSELARTRISCRNYQSHSTASSTRGNLMLMHVADATPESASCSRPQSERLRRAATISGVRTLFSTSPCSEGGQEFQTCRGCGSAIHQASIPAAGAFLSIT
jgi:hypothetical protein